MTESQNGPEIRVVLADDQKLVREGFRLVLGAQANIDVVGEAEDGEGVLDILRTLPVDVILMDVRMPRMDGVEATRRSCATTGSARVLILTIFDLDEYAYAALKAGASGFILKDVSPADLLSAIRSVHSGEAVVAPSTTRRLLDQFTGQLPNTGETPPPPASLEELTPREREVLALMARGLSNAEIAGRLVVSETTVKTHVGRVLTKLDLRDRVQAVVLAYETGLVNARNA
ncbi:response regulator transcription factor [Haloactinomyces albus]|uniref:DNA-binding NarL/FixJ family response regulator n=1 Tax=Haloactinomyces albus TaxID=1352928 RepID=A0AAE3ZIN9_9ACTN|nr:response regulator transcription factor [Haloactinomyces albus]MDR7304651.1 DNA-binding NarL/FixJ family response regulator [Haloactinomyces albus]